MTPTEFKQARQSLGLSQIQMADVLDYRQAHISDIERGKTPITRSTEIAVKAMLRLGLPEVWAA